MMERRQVNLRLERDLVEALDDLAGAEHVDRTEIARRILVEGVARTRRDNAIKAFAAGRASAWAVAELAGVSLYEMLDQIHETGVPYELDPEVLERIDSREDRSQAGDSAREGEEPLRALTASRRIGEAQGVYGHDSDTGTEALRERYRPQRVATLLVGESSPAGGTHFYRANSNLFRATRDAFVLAMGEAVVPTGDKFLSFFRDKGYWLVDLAGEPVNRMTDSERTASVRAGMDALAGIIRETRPEQVVVVKRNIEAAVRQALTDAGAEDLPLVVLPFPVRQWRGPYVEGLAQLAGNDAA